ncbi:hypothetical protein MMC07_006361 [Pseudocyphellaria aurata]|nr:hypothetical protein [Pseudocyphellaria aurata]
MHFNIVIPLFVTSAYAAVTSQNLVTGFDSIKGLNPVLNNIPIPYNGLYWDRWVARPDNPLSAIKAISPNNTAASASILNQVTRNGGSAVINSVFPGSRVSYFTLTSTFIGCAVQSQEIPGVPAPCDIFVTGTKTSGGQVFATCQYRGTLARPQLPLCTFPTSFNNLRNVTFVPVPIGSAVQPALFADDFRYTTFTTK